jgi:hypothetical protein
MCDSYESAVESFLERLEEGGSIRLTTGLASRRDSPGDFVVFSPPPMLDHEVERLLSDLIHGGVLEIYIEDCGRVPSAALGLSIVNNRVQIFVPERYRRGA